MTNIPTERPFDYMIKARYLDLDGLYSNVVTNTDALTKAIQLVWYSTNLGIVSNITEVEVKLADYSQFYTSTIKE